MKETHSMSLVSRHISDDSHGFYSDFANEQTKYLTDCPSMIAMSQLAGSVGGWLYSLFHSSCCLLKLCGVLVIHIDVR